MITLPPVSEAEGFDSLAIREIKFNKSDKKNFKKNEKNVFDTIHCLREQLGEDKCNKILGSKQYKNLHLANLVVFNAIEYCTKEGCIMMARELNAFNHQRTLAKKQLQKKFFPNSEITEVKT